MSAPPYDARAALSGMRRAWNDFFHAPVEPRTCAAIRIGYALLMLINIAVLWPDLERWFGDAGLVPRDLAQVLRTPDRQTVLDLLPGDARTLQWLAAVWGMQTLAVLCGAATRFNALGVVLWYTMFQHRNPLIWDAEDVVLRLMGWYLVFMPANRVWAVDAWLWRKQRTAPPCPGWALRLLQLQMCVIFLSAAWSKLQGEAWRSGTMLYFVSRLDDYFGRVGLPDFLFETPWLVRCLTWSVMVIEFAVPVLVWFRQTRWLALVLALAFHLANEVSMHLFLFHWAMLLGWSSFALTGDWEWLVRWGKKAAREPTQ